MQSKQGDRQRFSDENRASVFDISPLVTDEQRAAAAVLLGEAMRDNPLHVRVFGADPVRRQQRLSRFMGPLLRHVQAHGGLLGACAQGDLIGVLGMMQPGHCRPSWPAALRLAAVTVTTNPPGGTWRIGRWLAAWARHDPPEPHWHIGPLAVLPAYRGRGTGRRLMTHCCRRLDSLAATAWLETDLEINVALYETLGFTVIRRERVLGVANWFMRRGPVQEA
jgi:ribosomal protein S18 acetylase RimI-like enzyme